MSAPLLSLFQRMKPWVLAFWHRMTALDELNVRRSMVLVPLHSLVELHWVVLGILHRIGEKVALFFVYYLYI
jgi:hypothetical protein